MNKNIFAIGLTLLTNVALVQTQAHANTHTMQWNYLVSRADKLIHQEKKTHISSLPSIAIDLRRAWLTVGDPTLKSPAYLEIREKLSSYFMTYSHLKPLADWYKTASIEAIDLKMKQKEQEGKEYFKKDWKARMDEFGLITIWPIDSKPRGWSKVFYFKPDDDSYSDALALSNLEPGQEKFADFDISGLHLDSGPLMSLDW